MKLLVLVAAVAVVCIAGWQGATAASRAPARLQVVSEEFTFTPSRRKLPAGPAIVELYNLGEDEHDLVIRRIGSPKRLARIRPLRYDQVADRTVRLRVGRYLLWCSLADHRARGMETRITVTAPRR